MSSRNLSSPSNDTSENMDFIKRNLPGAEFLIAPHIHCHSTPIESFKIPSCSPMICFKTLLNYLTESKLNNVFQKPI